mmetsp:Transcript_32275/g.78123  ORF Transcript_32275/g.78123 Transcript_32275/m.78123 type:complete len:407 (-) Transcript_32275:75-1295(-)
MAQLVRENPIPGPPLLRERIRMTVRGSHPRYAPARPPRVAREQSDDVRAPLVPRRADVLHVIVGKGDAIQYLPASLAVIVVFFRVHGVHETQAEVNVGIFVRLVRVVDAGLRPCEDPCAVRGIEEELVFQGVAVFHALAVHAVGRVRFAEGALGVCHEHVNHGSVVALHPPAMGGVLPLQMPRHPVSLLLLFVASFLAIVVVVLIIISFLVIDVLIILSIPLLEGAPSSCVPRFIIPIFVLLRTVRYLHGRRHAGNQRGIDHGHPRPSQLGAIELELVYVIARGDGPAEVSRVGVRGGQGGMSVQEEAGRGLVILDFGGGCNARFHEGGCVRGVAVEVFELLAGIHRIEDVVRRHVILAGTDRTREQVGAPRRATHVLGNLTRLDQIAQATAPMPRSVRREHAPVP